MGGMNRWPSTRVVGLWIRGLSVVSLVASCGGVGPGPDPDETTRGIAPIVAAAERARARRDLDTAIDSYGEALARTPWNTRLKQTLAATYVERAARARTEGGFLGLVSARQDLEEAMALVPEQEAARYNLALILIEMSTREFDEARSAALREEARKLEPGLVEATPVLQAGVERRLDLAFELLQRGQLDAGIDDLTRIHEHAPDHPGATRLLAQAQVRKGSLLAERHDYEGAGERFDQAVLLYEDLGNCQDENCERDELRLAHRNRITTWIEAGRPERARRALDDAERVGLPFPDLRRAVYPDGGP